MKIKTRRYYIYYTLKILFFLIRLIPRCVSLVIADFLGKAAFAFLGKYRQMAISNLGDVFSYSPQENIRIARDVFRNLAKNGADWIKLFSFDSKKLCSLVTEVYGSEYLDEVLSKGNGAIVLGFHFGNWELLPLYLRSIGYDGAVVARRIYFYKYDKLIMRMRQRFDLKVIYRDESPKRMLRQLKEGKILGVVPDQDVDSVEGVFVDFFGKPAYTPTAPVKLAMAAGAGLIPSFMIRKPDNTYKLIIERPIPLASGKDKEEDVKRYTQIWTNVLERYVREYPQQWVWLHPRWKTKESTPCVASTSMKPS